jgi:hypothetical protein
VPVRVPDPTPPPTAVVPATRTIKPVASRSGSGSKKGGTGSSSKPKKPATKPLDEDGVLEPSFK